ncbi:dynein axonemal assembly factor 4-like [Lepeophtheirus salmonis]|uniref:dynein axonemal assembly factor 4-like n=1 Tax=Lepeophtheirus salmonis TaxID=72036 RepID=UPI001AEB772E|nr:dynein assembly factor 4, axonemal-like [Lepeophtheirus salmonis]
MDIRIFKKLTCKKSEDSSRLERKSIEKAIQRDEDSQRKLECQKNRIKDEFISSNTKTPLKNHINTNTPSRVNEVKCHDTSLLVKLAMEKDRILPVVRSPGCIMVTFTPRSAPTPLRENKKDNEGEWLRKKWEAFSRAEGLQVSENNEDLDPTQILHKGNYFISTGDILSAVSIYTHGIKLFPKMAAMYNNRSVAYIKIKNYEEALHDIHMALKFLLPPVNDNLNQRTKSTMRKSYILFKLDRIKDAINELDVASKLMPDNVEIASYLESLKELSDEDESLDESD